MFDILKAYFFIITISKISSTIYGALTMCQTLLGTIIYVLYLITTATLQDSYYYLYFIDENIE